jgi:hypothetical protein
MADRQILGERLSCFYFIVAIQNVPRRQQAEKQITMQRNGGGVKSLTETQNSSAENGISIKRK